MMKFGSGAGVWLSCGGWRLYRDKFSCPLDLSRVLLLYSHIFYGQMQFVSVALSCFLRLREVHLDLQSRAVIQHLRCAHLAWVQSSSYRYLLWLRLLTPMIAFRFFCIHLHKKNKQFFNVFRAFKNHWRAMENLNKNVATMDKFRTSFLMSAQYFYPTTLLRKQATCFSFGWIDQQCKRQLSGQQSRPMHPLSYRIWSEKV